MSVENVVLEVLQKLQKNGNAIVVGGYIRDRLLDAPINDIDILTSCSFEYLQELFSNLDWTENGIKVGVCRAVYRSVPFEFSFVPEYEFERKKTDRDFTVNSFYFDGKQLYSQHKTADEDLKQKILRPIEPFQKHLEHSPVAILRAIRFTSKYQFSMTPSLVSYVNKNTSLLTEVSKNRITREAYDILNGNYPINALYWMMEAGLLTKNELLKNNKDIFVKKIVTSLQARIVYLSHLVGSDTLKEFIDIFDLSPSFSDIIDKYISVFDEASIQSGRKDFTFITMLKRYQFNDDKDKLKQFLTKKK